MFGWNKVIEKDAFMRVIGNDLNFLETVISLFESQAKDSLDTLSGALVTPDWPSYLRATHDLKNMGRSIASTKLIEHADILEQFAEGQNVVQAQAALKNTAKLLGKARAELIEIGANKASRKFPKGGSTNELEN